MNTPAALLLCMLALPAGSQTMVHSSAGATPAAPEERLGTVSFPISCASPAQAPFSRGVALLHDFWYGEAKRQFDALTRSDPACAMAHWGLAMSVFHQIWDRPDADIMALGWAEMQKAQALPVGTDRERAYIAALAGFYRPRTEEYATRIGAYSAAMGKLYAQYPGDGEAGAFYALSLLASEAPDDTSLAQQRKAMAVLSPLFARFPDNPGVVHYIIHACDNPAMAPEALRAADHYGEIAPSGPHAFHMPGHIYARLGLWPQDIASQLGSIAASQAAEARGEGGMMDEPHSFDFLLYAYLQSGDDADAQSVLDQSAVALTSIASMHNMGSAHRPGMISYYRVKLPAFNALERRDWASAAALEPQAGSPPEASTLVYWARALAHGRLHQPEQARADLARYDKLMEEIRSGQYRYMAEGTAPEIERGEILAWTAFAEGKQDDALTHMRKAADLQDKVGQGEVDIPAREMLADMLLEFGHPQQALTEYKTALTLSPNRLNGLYNAGRAAEAAGDKPEAARFYAALLKSTRNGESSSRPELAHARTFAGSGLQARQ